MRPSWSGLLLRSGTAATVLAATAWAGPLAQAQEDDRALAGFARPPATAPRGEPVQPREWEMALRAADRFGPPVLRAGDAALLAAVRAARFSEALELLKSHRAGANAQDDDHGNALVMAARAGQDELVRELIQRGADKDRIGEDGFTALGSAAFAGHRSTVRLLVRAGVDVSRWGATGQTALHLAAIAGQTDVLDELLLRARMDIDTLNRQRETALDAAAGAGQQDAMEQLIKAGADMTQAGRR